MSSAHRLMDMQPCGTVLQPTLYAHWSSGHHGMLLATEVCNQGIIITVTAHLPHAVKGVCLPVEAHQLVPAVGHTGGAYGAAVQGKWSRTAVAGGTL